MQACKARKSRPSALLGGQPIPGYRLIRRRGWGGYAEVWEAEAPGGFRVALKLVRLSAKETSGELRAVDVVREIRHPNLLALFGAWQVDDLLVIGMELADRSLWDRFLEATAHGLRGIPRSELLGYLSNTAAAVDYLNEYRHSFEGREKVGVQHRDLKPQNILLFSSSAKLADFGMVRVMDHSVASHHGSWTLPYAAPEFFDGRTTRQSDQYGLAVTYCQLRSGRLPFNGTVAQITAGHLFAPPDLDDLPGPERPIVERALAKRPERRWPDCRAFIAALESLGSVPDLLEADGTTEPLAFGSGSFFFSTDTAALPNVPASLTSLPAIEATGPTTVAVRNGFLHFGAATLIAAAIACSTYALRASLARTRPEAPASGMALVEIPRRPAPSTPDRPVLVTLHSAPTPERVGGSNREVEPRPPVDLDARTRDEVWSRFGRRARSLMHLLAEVRASMASGEGPEMAAQALAIDLRTVAAPGSQGPAQSDFEQGRAHLTRGEYARAIATFTDVLRHDPIHPGAYFHRGIAQQLVGRPREALADYTEAIRLRPDDPDPYVLRGRVLHVLGRNDRALEDLSAALRLRPDNATALLARGAVHHALGAYDRALADLSAAVRLRPSDPKALYRRGLVRYHAGDNPGAIADFTETLRLDPSDVGAYRYRGEAYARLGDGIRAGADHDALDRLVAARSPQKPVIRPVNSPTAPRHEAPKAKRPPERRVIQ